MPKKFKMSKPYPKHPLVAGLREKGGKGWNKTKEMGVEDMLANYEGRIEE
ncbi:hypothetical protein IC582_015741 [Cucumis melo]